ncbi:MAG: Hsp20/alpha crystallin family protein [Synechococcales cyanobacterium T60_A2020_003]|nr:Hsp20/alpha crystallin family protein [Synechococcales cyanobacterium T60_A2020_003]
MAIMQRDPVSEIAHWEPFRGIENLRREMNRLFDRLVPIDNGGERSLSFMPSMEMEETDDTLYLKIEVPGMESKDLTVEATTDSIVVKGERKSESKTEDKGIVRSEMHYGSFERRIPLSSAVQVDQIQGECKNGILTLTLPKTNAEPSQPTKVKLS